MFFDNVQRGAPDAMYFLKIQADNDTALQKVDLGAGIYRNEEGVCHEMKVLRDVGYLPFLSLSAALNGILISRLGEAAYCSYESQPRCRRTIFIHDPELNLTVLLTRRQYQYEVTTGNAKF